MAQAMNKDRISLFIRDTPCLRNKVANAHSKASGKTLLRKVFTGRLLTLSKSNRSGLLSARPVRLVSLDEISIYPKSIAREGSPILLA
uniref:Bacteriophage tail assembly protein n=1 Tax=uncultured delta proteobacterium HF0130_05G09 TaxID=710827 RepID=E0XXL9_9DELT|nr:bacteriophage tail assembly protein [uncultured delta proteobacterium HF0130_05G09]